MLTSTSSSIGLKQQRQDVSHCRRTSHQSLSLMSHLLRASFSVNTLRTKLPLRCASNVDGTMTYSPGCTLKRSHTSLKLMKFLLRATASILSRTSGPRWMLLRPLNWPQNKKHHHTWENLSGWVVRVMTSRHVNMSCCIIHCKMWSVQILYEYSIQVYVLSYFVPQVNTVTTSCLFLTSSGTWENTKHTKIKHGEVHAENVSVCMWVFVCVHLIDGETNGVEVSSKASLSASVFLHQSDQGGAAVLGVVRLIVHGVESDKELRVRAESGCTEKMMSGLKKETDPSHVPDMFLTCSSACSWPLKSKRGKEILSRCSWEITFSLFWLLI